jgi:precorrin-6Y C5,15-methyltransferase (decarboxylating)
VTAWLAIVGLGEDGLDGVSPAVRPLVDAAEIVVGGDRHLAMLPDDHPAERLTWATPLLHTIDAILARRGRRVCVLATGDPMWYGIGVTLARHVPAAERTIVPSPSAFSLACARLGWPLAEVEALTLHGRPLDLLRAYVAPGARLLLLANDGDSPREVAALLDDLGYGPSTITVLEHMGGAKDRRLEDTAERWQHPRAANLNTIAVTCRAGANATAHPRTPGLPDCAYHHDGQITKREVRAVTLAALAPFPGHLLWDVGAGCGSIAIEWLRAARGSRAVAIERNAERSTLISRNAAALGTPTLEIVTGGAPAALEGLDTPDAVFIGGGITEPDLVEACWDALAPGGRLVANVVTIEGEAALAQWRERIGGELTRMAISRIEPLGAFGGWRPLVPVTRLSVTKQ